MFFQLLVPAVIARLAYASPLATRSTPGAGFPEVSQAKGFTLVANVTGESKVIFDPPINEWSLIGIHVGAGQNAAILHSGPGSVFFVNGTGQDVSRTSTSINLPPIPYTDSNGTTRYTPYGMQFSSSFNSETEVYIGLNFGIATSGAGISHYPRDVYPRLFGPFDGGFQSFVVCNESEPAYGRPQYPVFAELGDIPDNCVPINLLAQCAELPDLGGAVDELNIIVEDAECYEDVSAIDWSQY